VAHHQHTFHQSLRSQNVRQPKPFLIAKSPDEEMRLTVRDIRYNSQGYPIVTQTLLETTFKSAAAARAHASEHYNAKPGEFAAK
jgi:hypothetical protein